MSCSPPFKIGKEWLNRHAGDICAYHDAEWVKREWGAKFKADFVASYMFASRGLILLMCGVLSVPYFLTLGTLYWMWKKYA